MKKSTKILGRMGEDLSKQYLKKLGYRIIDQNLLLRIGEVDILAEDQGYLVIVEVKTVSGVSFGPAKGYVNFRKREKLRHLAGYLMQQHPAKKIRIDVVGVEIINDQVKIEHIKNAVEGLE